MAGRPSGDGDTLQVERNDQRLAVKVIKPDIRGVGRPGDRFTVESGAVEACAGHAQKLRFEPVTERCNAVNGSIFKALHSQLGRFGKAGNAGYVFGASAPTALMAAAHQER